MSKNIDAMLETARDLRLDAITIKEIEMLNLSEVKEKVSQAVMARILNVTPSTYQKWERGEVHPKGCQS